MDNKEIESKIDHLNKMVVFLTKRIEAQDRIIDLLGQSNKADVTVVTGFNNIIARLDIDNKQITQDQELIMKLFTEYEKALIAIQKITDPKPNNGTTLEVVK